jgi:DNA-binding SARP family transcriptional activator
MLDRLNLSGSDDRPQEGSDPLFCFRLLGQLQIACGGEPLPLPPFRVFSLLAALLLYPRPQGRERLIGLLFPDIPERTGRRRLSDLLWLLRQTLPKLPLQTSSQTVCLDADSRWLDVEAFRQAASGPELDDRLRALALYRGDLLESAYDDWLLPERETLYLQYVRLAHQVSAELLQRQRLDELLPLAERLVQTEPYDEQALRTLMQAYRAVGRRGAALAAYERFLGLATDELGAKPEPATQALAESIRTTAAPAPLPSAIPSPGDETAEAMLCQARAALARGDRATVQEVVRRLRARHGDRDDDACLLEVDLALLCEEFDHAALLLCSCDAAQGPVLVRLARLALERRQAAAAHDAASEALIHAHEMGDRHTELEAVLALAHAQRQLGQGVQAARSSDQALGLARACGSMEGITRALMMQGHNSFRQGQYAEALASYHEARSLAHEHGLLCCLADALHWIAWIQSYQGALLAALASGQQALSLVRDLGLAGREAGALQSLAYTLAQLGRTAEGLRALEQAGQICARLGEPVRAAVNQYHLADTMLYHDDALAPRVIALAQAALATFRAHEQVGWEAALLCTQGHALSITGRHQAALDAFRRSYTLYEQVGELAFLPELLAQQGLAHLGLGEHEWALDCTRQALLAMAQGEVSGEVVPEIYYAHAMALAVAGDEAQARATLARAYHRLLAAAAQFQDEAARQAYFHHTPTMRRLMQAVYARGIAPAPGSGVVVRQMPSSQGGRTLQIRWTVDAGPADLALRQARGAIVLRRTRLGRLLQEARWQGATPTLGQLAEALDVSERTVQRDLAALRRDRGDESRV